MKSPKRYGPYAKYGILFCLPGFLGFLIFLVVPIGFSTYNALLDGGGNFALFRNIKSLADSPAYLLAMRNTGLYLLVGGGLSLIMAFLLSWGLFYLLRRSPNAAAVIKICWLLPLLIPTAVSVLFVELLFAGNGAVNAWMGTQISWLSTSPYAFWIMVFMYIWKNFGYFVIVFLGAFGGIASEQFEAAGLDGAGSVHVMAKIVFPQVLSSVFFAIIMGIIGVFKMNRESYLLFGNYPNDSAYMFQNFITNNLANMEYSRAATASMLLLVLFSVGIGFMVKYQERCNNL